MKYRLAVEAAWVIGGQLATALGTLVGVRLLTQVLPPATYGEVSLALGISTLLITLICAPATQAAIHLYPELAGQSKLVVLRRSLRRILLRQSVPVVLLVLLAGVVMTSLGYRYGILALILAPFLASDCIRTANLSVLNAGRRQTRYSTWMTTDAWARPLAAALAAVTFGALSSVVLGAQFLVSAVLVLVFSRNIWPSTPPSVPLDGQDADIIERRMWSYALPLVPLGVIGWACNLGDRYLIGGTLGVAEAGIYAAIYGLSSMPFTAVGGTIEQALRPVYQQLVAEGRHREAGKLLNSWLIAVAGTCGIGVLIFWHWNQDIAGLVLGKPYRNAANLMPWIAFGYAIRSTSYVFERVCYAYGDTRKILSIQSAGALATLVATPVGALGWGLIGAAVAVPVYFSVQLAMALFYARQAFVRTSSAGQRKSLPA